MKKVCSFLLALVMILSFSTVAFAFDAGTATLSTPWYGICLGDGVRIRASASTSSDILGQIDNRKPIEVVGVPNSSWYKVRYDESGNTGYIYSSYISIYKANYGRVIRIHGVDLKAGKGSTTNVTHAPYGTCMPYRELSPIDRNNWADCVFGRTAGWVDTANNYDFKYEDF